MINYEDDGFEVSFQNIVKKYKHVYGNLKKIRLLLLYLYIYIFLKGIDIRQKKLQKY